MIDKKIEEKITQILNGNAEALVQLAEDLGRSYAPQNPSKREKETKLSSSQIRNILDDVQRMKEVDPDKLSKQLIRLRPKLAYTAGRAKKENCIRELQQIIDKAIQLATKDIDKVNDRFIYFKEFFEAIVGYHRYHSKIREA